MFSGTITGNKRQGHNPKRKLRTIPDVCCLDDLEFLFDVRIKKPIKIKAIRAFLPSSEVSYFVPVHNVAFGTQLIDVAHFGVYCGQQQARVADRAITYITGAIIPGQAHPCVEVRLGITSRALGGSFWREKFHDSCYGVRGAVSNRPTRRAINMVLQNMSAYCS